MGTFIPDMGTKRRAPSLAGALFTPVQQRVLGLLYGQPDRRFQSAELIRLARGGTGAVHRQIQRLAAAELVTVTAVGNQRFYQANQASPVFHDLHGLIARTVGLAEPIRRALEPFAREIRAAFVYGSVASGADRSSSDVDLMVIADALDHASVYRALQLAEAVLGRPVNPTLLTRAEWRRRRASAGSFAARLADGPRIMVLGTDDVLA
jgi:predicted nucleotidyltransferase